MHKMRELVSDRVGCNFDKIERGVQDMQNRAMVVESMPTRASRPVKEDKMMLSNRQ